jgi:hypothetical protein
METILVKIFATALALSQVTTTPDTVKTQFDRVRDQEQVAQLLHAGCTHMRKAFDIEDINLEELIATALDDPQAAGENKAFRGINFADLQMAYREFCKNERVVQLTVDLREVIDFYNKSAADLPDHTKLKGLKLPGASVVLDRKGERFAEVFEENQRRVWVPLADIPEHVQKAFLAAEDKRFYQHKGVDERGLIRAFIGNLASLGRPPGLDVLGVDRDTALGVVENVALDSVPPLRRRAYECVCKYRDVETADVAVELGLPTVSTRRILEELAAHGLVIRRSLGQGRADRWDRNDWEAEA